MYLKHRAGHRGEGAGQIQNGEDCTYNSRKKCDAPSVRILGKREGLLWDVICKPSFEGQG